MMQIGKNQDIAQVRLFLFDMDGTLYLGNRLFDFTEELLRAIRESGRQYLFMTNNSSKSVVDYVKKLERLGIPAREEDFITSSQATAYYLKQHHPHATLYVCGTRSLKEELTRAGFAVTERLSEVDCIVMGYDTELTFQKLEDVCRLLLGRELPYIATNPDLVCPTEFGSLPDCGSVCEMIFNATGKRPFVIGKPAALMPNLAMERMGVAPLQTAVVGDRIYTDIKSGLNAGTRTILVMSGETTKKILEASPADLPEFILADCGEIIPLLRSNSK